MNDMDLGDIFQGNIKNIKITFCCLLPFFYVINERCISSEPEEGVFQMTIC